jgi:hypothetical protein
MAVKAPLFSFVKLKDVDAALTPRWNPQEKC